MNKGRSRMFSEKMKGVFKPRSRPQVTPKSQDDFALTLKPETHKEIRGDAKKNRSFQPYSESLRSDKPHSVHAIPKESNVNSEEAGCDTFANVSAIRETPQTCLENTICGSRPSVYTITPRVNTDAERRMSARTDSHQKRFIKDKESFKVNEFASGIGDNDRFKGISRVSDPKEENIINESCQVCPLDLDTNRTSRDMIYDRESPSRSTNVKDLDLTNQTGSFWSNYKSFKSGLDICYYCLKQNCICRNNNLTPTNNKYYFSGAQFQHRKSSLFSSVLQYAFGEERTNRNDFIILALGIHHYIKEVFNAMDLNNNGYVHYGDLQILCKILGKEIQDLNKQCTDNSSGSERINVTNSCANNSCETHLHLAKFSEIIGNLFSDQKESDYFEKRKNTQLVNAMVNVTRRNKSLIMLSEQLEQLEKDYIALKNNAQQVTNCDKKSDVMQDRSSRTNSGSKVKSDSNTNNVYLENLKLQKIILLQQQELQCLREVIEDLRVSLQCSDAENLCLKVQDAKMQESSYSDSSEDISSPNLSSSEDENDSIDIIIQNFPSSEQLLMNSKESLLSFESLNTLVPDLSTSASLPPYLTKKTEDLSPTKRRSTFPRSANDEDLSLEKEIQIAYKNLSETRSELEETRNDLESTVSQIQDKDSRLKQLHLRLTETKTNYEKSVKENSILKEKFVRLKKENETMSFNIGQLQQDLEEMHADLIRKDEEIFEFSNKLKDITVKRHEDIQKLANARDIIATSIREAKKNEDLIKSFLKTRDNSTISPYGEPSKPPGQVSTPGVAPVSFEHLVKMDKNNNKTLNSAMSPGSVEAGKEVWGKRSTAEVTHGSGSSSSARCETSVSTESALEERCSEEKYRMPLSPYELRMNDGDCKNQSPSENQGKKVPNPVPSRVHHNSSPQEKKENSEATTAVSHTANHSNCSSNCNTSSSNISSGYGGGLVLGASDVIKHIKMTSSKEKSSLVTSPLVEDKPTMEVKPNLIKPIPVLKPLWKTSTFLQELPKSSKDSLFIMKNEKPENELKNSYLDSKFEQEEDILIPMKGCIMQGAGPRGLDSTPKSFTLPRTSTQILEGLEAEVEFLRKSLDQE